jgi:tetratricopeptide (TPR) repeat protein
MHRVVAFMLLFFVLVAAAPAPPAGPDVFELGKKALRDKEYSRAIGYFTTMIHEEGDNPLGYKARAVAYYQSGRVEKAIKDLTQVLRLSPGDWEAYNNRGVAYGDLKQYDKAVRDLSRAIALNPRRADSYSSRGVYLSRLGKQDLALEDFDHALRLDARSSTAHANRGDAHTAMQDYDAAVADFTRAIQLTPKSDRAYLGRALAHKKKHEYEHARADYRKARELSPDDPAPAGRLAWLLATCPEARVRDGKAAVGYAKKACDLTRWRNLDYLDTLAAAYAEAGDFENAKKYQALVVSHPDAFSEEAFKKVRQRLELYEQGKPYRESQ